MKTIGAIICLFCLITSVQAQASLSVRQLVHQSDFIGLVQADAGTTDIHSPWRQWVMVTAVDSIKGILLPTFGNKQYPPVKADHAGFPGYPTRFGEPGEYLVFLKGPETNKSDRWTTLAAYYVQYFPEGLGGLTQREREHIIGLVSDSTSTPPSFHPVVNVKDARHWLEQLTLDQKLTPVDDLRLNAFFHTSRQPETDFPAEIASTYEQRFVLAKKLADAVPLGMTRAEVEKVFPRSDGGAFGSDHWRYYFGSEVMIGVPYDTTGGPFQPVNKVNGPLRVYRSLMHMD